MANGNFAGGDGTVNNPYLIEDAHDLNAVRNKLDKHYKLIKDIDLDVPPYNEGEGWTPIGTSANQFQGSLDGDFKKIKKLYIKRDRTYTGLFGRTTNAKLSNIIIDSANITGADRTGSLVGECYKNNIISNCSCYNINMEINNIYSGGFVGTFNSTGNIIENCGVHGRIYTSKNIEIGGFIDNVSYENNISNSYSMCDVISNDSVNGFARTVDSRAGFLKNCYSSGENNKSFLGVVDDKSAIKNCFWNKEKSNVSSSQYGVGLTTQQMQTAQTFIDAGWDKEVLEDGTPVWILKDGQYPRLWFEKFEKSPYKFLIKQNNQYYTIKPEYYSDGKFQPLTLEGGEQPNENDYENFGFDDVNDLLTSQNTKVIQGTDMGVLGEGKYFEVELDNEIKKVNNIELK